MKRVAFLLWFSSVHASVAVNPHIAFGEGSDMGLSWQAPVGTPCSSISYGMDLDSLSSYATAEKTCTLYQGDTFYHVVLRNLRRYTLYFYKIECSGTSGTFRTAPEPGIGGSFTFAVYADLGPARGENTIHALNGMSAELAGHIFAGDIGYADDAFMHAESYISRTNEFLREIAPSSGSVPIMVAPGNHEAEDHSPLCLLSADCRQGLGNFTAFNCIWNMPSEHRSHSMWHSFDYGPIHFVMINTETDYEGAPLEGYGEVGWIPTGKFGLPGEFEEWLQNDLEKAANSRHVRPWIIVAGHRPITVLDDNSDPFVTPLNEQIIQLIGTHADAYISGHVHYYARSTPKPTSPLQAHFITVGGSGCDEWDERRVKNTRKGTSEHYNFFGFGEEQTFGMLSFNKEKPDELVFNLLTSKNREVIDTVVLPRRDGPHSSSSGMTILLEE